MCTEANVAELSSWLLSREKGIDKFCETSRLLIKRKLSEGHISYQVTIFVEHNRKLVGHESTYLGVWNKLL